ncbi:uncharacterized protein LOC125470280 [Pyrus x bretschneideri]|uniref:uncharacterized protein LOC125470280 n=1 Tax=Pyrus x bretschneideri TaxID=225117 RepID=UPI002030B791|nr:uncharacterized protein LOC125470280 [Pyrus x bretschneideri]
MGYVDGSTPYPSQHVSMSGKSGNNSPVTSSTAANDEYVVWKMHDRAIMQLITAMLSPIALSCAIGSTSSKDLWVRLREQFSTVSRTNIFQMKSNLQTIKKGSDLVSQYFHQIKEARDYLFAAGVYFVDEDIVILAVNGLLAKYNTFKCVIRGRESVISLKDFKSHLLAEEAIVDNSTIAPFMTAMVVNTGPSASKGSNFHTRGFSHTPGQSQFAIGGFKPYTGNKNKSKGRFNQGSRFYNAKPVFSTQTHVLPNSNPGLLGQSPGS